MTIVIYSARTGFSVVGRFAHVGPDERVIRCLTGTGHSERADILLDILDPR